ncbi:reverse transcriptase domain-containing protein [Tanacetum coccineum]
MTQLLVKDAPFSFSKECTQAFDKLKHKLTQASIMIKPDWSLPFEVMCDASDYDVEAALGQRIDKHFKPIHYASKTMNEVQENYTTTGKELLAVVFAFDKFRQYLVLSKTIKGVENLAADHLSQLENLDLGKLTKAEIRDLFPEERLMAVSDKNNEPCNIPLELYSGGCVDPWRTSSGYTPLLQEKSLKQMEKAMKRFGVVHRFSTAYHPQTNEQVENTNRAIKRILKKTTENNRKDWSYKLDDALWAFRTAFKTPLGTTPFRIIYGKACHLSINELDEIRLDAYESSISYKERTKRWHDKQIKAPTNYKRGDKVLLFNSRLRLFPGKLKSRWHGPFSISKDMKNGAIELYDEDGNEFIVIFDEKKLRNS